MSPEEYRGKRDWLRSNPHGLRARMVEDASYARGIAIWRGRV